jgi:hypothetical protein
MNSLPQVVGIAALVTGLVSCGHPTTPPPVTAVTSPNPTVVAGGTTIPRYEAKYFGTSWPRIHGDCDLREVILERDSITPVDTDGDGCRDDGDVIDPYTGETVPAALAQIDHVMSKKDAWDTGAWQWSMVQRRIFFTDTANLRAVRGTLNESKGDRGPDQWRPPKQGWCAYSVIYTATAARWQLELTPAKKAALSEMHTTCGVPAAPVPASPVPPPCAGEKPGACPDSPGAQTRTPTPPLPY